MELNFGKPQLEVLRELQRNTSDRDIYQKLTTLLMLHNKFKPSTIADNLGILLPFIVIFNQYQESSHFEDYLAAHYKPCVGKLNKITRIC